MGGSSALVLFHYVEFADDGLREFSWTSVHNLHRRAPSSTVNANKNAKIPFLYIMCGNIDFITQSSPRLNMLLLLKETPLACVTP